MTPTMSYADLLASLDTDRVASGDLSVHFSPFQEASAHWRPAFFRAEIVSKQGAHVTASGASWLEVYQGMPDWLKKE